jgi:hypothetical protein
MSTRTVDDLLSDLREVCTCVGENRAQEGDELCLFCDSRLQIEAQQRTIGLLQDRFRPPRTSASDEKDCACPGGQAEHLKDCVYCR